MQQIPDTYIDCFISALNKSGFTKNDLIGQLPLKEVLKKFLAWIAAMVRMASKRNNGTRYFPGK